MVHCIDENISVSRIKYCVQKTFIDTVAFSLLSPCLRAVHEDSC